MKEMWRPIKGYEGLYEISNQGRVKSLTRYCMSFGYRKTLLKEKIMKPSRSPSGYFQVGLSKNGKRRHFFIHRLVATTFISNPNNYLCINHKDEVKTNNCVNNLEWCTTKYNNNYGTARKRAKRTFIINKTKGINDIDKALLNTHVTKTALAKRLGISKWTLRHWLQHLEDKKRKKKMLEVINALEDEWQKNNEKQINDLIKFRKLAKRIFN